MWVGVPGSHGTVNFSSEDPHFRQALNSVLSLGGTMPLGHTHPSGYGPIFSHVEVRNLRDDDSDESADYSTAIHHAQHVKSALHFMVALNPEGHPMLGVIRVKNDHAIVFHPWKSVISGHLRSEK